MAVTAPSKESRAVSVVLLLLGLASVLKVAWACNSVGSFDAAMFFRYARHLHDHTLASFYESEPMFNHTPATACLIRGLYETAPGNYRIFAPALRLLCTLADASVVLGLIRLLRQFALPPVWALAAFAISPVSIMISGFHGNVDPIMTAFLFYAAFFAVHRRPLWCGAFLGAACNVKIVPILLIPIFFFFWLARGRRALLAFCWPVALLLGLGMGWPLWFARDAFLSHVFGYGGYWGGWGITYWLRMTGWDGFQAMYFAALPPWENRVMLALKVIAVAAVLALAWRRRGAPPLALFGTLSAAFTVLYVLAPGGGVQYMVWFAPFLLIESPRWWVATTVGATLYLYAYYHVSAHGPFPWFYVFPRTGEEALWAPWANLAWGMFVALLVARGRTWFRPPTPEAVTS